MGGWGGGVQLTKSESLANDALYVVVMIVRSWVDPFKKRGIKGIKRRKGCEGKGRIGKEQKKMRLVFVMSCNAVESSRRMRQAESML